MSKPKIEAAAELIWAGTAMSNVFFNLSQRGDGVSNIHLAANEYALFKELYQRWDDVVKNYRRLKRRKP